MLNAKCLVVGTLSTPATWIRKFVASHPDYKKDSVVSQVINYDLLKAVDEMFVEMIWLHFTLLTFDNSIPESAV